FCVCHRRRRLDGRRERSAGARRLRRPDLSGNGTERMSHRALLLAAMLLAAPVLAAQDASSLAGRSRDQTALAGVDQRLVNRFPASVAVRLDALVDSAASLGLPTEPLVLRALEGGAKGVPADRIQTSLSRLLGSLGRARDALG